MSLFKRNLDNALITYAYGKTYKQKYIVFIYRYTRNVFTNINKRMLTFKKKIIKILK